MSRDSQGVVCGLENDALDVAWRLGAQLPAGAAFAVILSTIEDF